MVIEEKKNGYQSEDSSFPKNATENTGKKKNKDRKEKKQKKRHQWAAEEAVRRHDEKRCLLYTSRCV